MSKITPAQVAAALTGGDDVNEVLNRWVDVQAIPGSSTVRITVTPISEGGDPDTENAQHFRAVVVEGEGPVVVASPEFLAAARAMYRWYVAASTLTSGQFTALVRKVNASLAALTPDQVAVLAEDATRDGVL